MREIWFVLIVFGLLVASISIKSVRGDLCEICECPNYSEPEHSDWINCSASNRTQLPLDNIPWSTRPYEIRLSLNRLGYTYLPKLLGSPVLVEINLDNNAIDSTASEPFHKCANLISVSLANNSIEALPTDFLKSLVKLRHLNLSANHLSLIDETLFRPVHNLQTLDLSHNMLTDLTVEFIGAIPSVTNLNLEGNQIFVVQSGRPDKPVTQSSVTDLNLARNKFTLIASRMFENFVDNLQTLNLSHNQLTNIEHTAFTQHTSLTTLDLSHNHLTDISLTLPDSLQHLILSDNQLRTWPMHNLPAHLVQLQLQQNQLFKIFDNNQHWLPNRLASLNLSHNQIDSFPSSGLFSELNELDLGHNMLVVVPGMLGEQAPKLRTLVLDGNPIADVRFNGSMTLEYLSMSQMPVLQVLDEASFVNLGAKHDKGLHIRIASCPKLDTVSPGVFNNLTLFKLDLSYNRLESIPQSAANWSSISSGIDLQGNPLVCNCSSQWLLDEILNILYADPKHQHFLLDLRCHSPASFEGHRLVRYLKHRGAFCHQTGSYRMDMNYQLRSAGFSLPQDDGVYIRLTQGPGFFIAISVCAITLILLVLVGIYLTRLQRRRRAQMNRRYIY